MTFPNSEASVVSTVALALEQFLIVLREEIPGIQYVYDEKLSFETALSALRANNNQANEVSNAYPLFAFKRSVLRYSKDGMNKRSITNRVKGIESGGSVPIYRSLHGEFDLQFMYVAKTMDNLERFEVAYLCEESFSEDRELEVDLTPEIGATLKYYLSPSPLEDKTVESEGMYYKAAMGTLVIRGFFLVFRENVKQISSISLKIKEFNHNLINQRLIL